MSAFLTKGCVALALAGSLMLPAVWAQREERAELLYRGAVRKETVEGNLKGAISDYQKVVSRAGPNRTLAAQALMRIGQCYEKLGDQQARSAYERLVREYADQPAIASQARSRLAALTRPRTAGPPAISFRQIWAGQADATGSPSPDGRYLSFTDWNTGGDLAIRDLVTGQNRRITDNSKSPEEGASSVWTSIFSPDARQLAYLWMGAASQEVRVIGVDGAGQRSLYRSQGFQLSVHDWSADGRWILARDGKTLLLISPLDGTTRQVRAVEWAGSRMLFSPDALWVVYSAEIASPGLGSEIRLVSTDGSRDIRLVDNAVHDIPLGWAGEGRFVLFASDRSGSVDIWVQGVREGVPDGAARLLKRDAGRLWPMGLTRTGVLFYELSTDVADVYTAELDLPGGKLLSPPKLAGHRFVSSNRFPQWSPDGKSLLYASARPMGQRTLVIQDAQSGREREIRPVLRAFTRHAWRPDGAIIVSGTGFDKRSGLYSINAQSGEVALVVEHGRIPQGQPDVVWSKDCRTMWAYSADALYRLNLATGTLDRLYSAPAKSGLGVALLSLSPDEGQLVFQLRSQTAGLSNLLTMPASGGAAREIMTMPFAEHFGCCRALSWTQDSKYVLGARANGDVWLVPVDGGAPVKTELSMRGLKHVSLHPDGRRVAFTAGEQAGEIWVMENFLPLLETAARTSPR